MKDDNFKVGDKIDMLLGAPPYYRTVIDDIIGETTVVVPIPTYRGITVAIHRDQDLQMFYYRPNGRFCVDARVTELHLDSDIRTAELVILSPPRKEQRRASYRVPARIKTVVCLPPPPDGFFTEGLFAGYIRQLDDEQKEIAYTKGISETGVSIVMGTSYEPGDNILLEIYLPLSANHEAPFSIMSEVRRCHYDEVRKTYQVGLQFLDISEKTRTILSRYILTRQQQLLRQQRLIEGE